MPVEKEKITEERILNAAMKVFTRKGFAATRTEDIAKEAAISRTLLHYYFRDKQTIFNIIFETRFKEFFVGLFSIFNDDNKSLFDKIKGIVDHEITLLIKHPDLARFIITEVATQPELLIEYGKKLGINPRQLISSFDNQAKKEAAEGTIKPINGKHIIINIMSLCVYPFVAQPVVQTMMQFDNATFIQEMENRKTEVAEFIINAIKK